MKGMKILVMELCGADLMGLPLFKDLSEKEIDQFLQATGVQIKTYGKKERILRAYEKNNCIGVIVEGEAFVITEDRFGNESISHQLQRGSMFGSTSAILPVTNISSIETITPTTAILVTYHDLITVGPRLGRIHGVVMKNLLEAFSRKNFLMMQKVELLTQKSLRERIILYLLQQEKQERGENGKIPVPGRIRLAKILECKRRALTREVRSMEEKGILICGEDWMQLVKDKLND